MHLIILGELNDFLTVTDEAELWGVVSRLL